MAAPSPPQPGRRVFVRANLPFAGVLFEHSGEFAVAFDRCRLASTAVCHESDFVPRTAQL